MNGEWQVVFDEVPFRLFLSRRLSEWRILLSAFDSLKTDPYQRPDFDIQDISQRQLSIRAFRPFLITYWLDAIITVEGLGKKYRLGQRSNERYRALRDVLTQKAQGIFKRGRNGRSAKIDNEILASRAVSLQANRDRNFMSASRPFLT